jgi:hypothetical protein
VNLKWFRQTLRLAMLAVLIIMASPQRAVADGNPVPLDPPPPAPPSPQCSGCGLGGGGGGAFSHLQIRDSLWLSIFAAARAAGI